MKILCVFFFCRFVAYASGCVTQENKTLVNIKVLGIALDLANVGAITYDAPSGTAEVKLTIPELLDTICTSSGIKDLLQEIHELVSECPQLLNESAGLQMLNIKGIDMGALFTDFDNMEAFCSCRSPVAAAWVIRAKKDHLQYENAEWFYNTTADAYAVCSNAELRGVILQFDETSEECRNATKKQAYLVTVEANHRFQRLAKLAETDLCSNFTSDTDLTCVSYDDLHEVNSAVETVSEHLDQYVDKSSENHTVAEEGIPTVLNMLCNSSSLRPAMEKIENLTSQCHTLAEISTPFGPLNINGWIMADFFRRFPNHATFCDCRHGLVSSWRLKDKEGEMLHTDTHAAFNTTAHVGNICGTELKRIIETIENAPEGCKQVYPNSNDRLYSDLYGIVKVCNTSINITSDWACTTSIATSYEFKTCIAEAETRIEDQALCGKYQCVFTEMQGCGVTARDLYIKAVNVENSDGIKESYDGCDGASGLYYSMLVLIVGCLLSVM